VWFHPHGIANSLSLARVKERHRVTYDSSGANAFLVHKANGTVCHFTQSTGGLYYYDAAGDHDLTVLVTTVADNQNNYTNKAYSCTLLARCLQRVIGQPSTKDLIRMMDNGTIQGCPLNWYDVAAADDLFGLDVGSLKGKTTWQAPHKVPETLITIPSSVLEQYQEVTLSVDVMFVNKLPIFITISHHLRFGTAELLSNCRPSTFASCVQHVTAMYKQHGFVVKTILANGKFEPIRGPLAKMHIGLNCASKGEHVPVIE